MTTPDRFLQVLLILLGIGSVWGLVKLAEDIMGYLEGKSIISHIKAIESAKVNSDYCKEQRGCQRAELERVKAGALITSDDWLEKDDCPYDGPPQERALSVFKKCGYSYSGMSGAEPPKEDKP